MSYSLELTAIARPEAALLVACARTTLEEGEAENIARLLKHEPNWDELIELAMRHQSLPLLYRNLHTTAPELVPPAVLERLRQYSNTIARTNLLLTGELLKLLALFSAHGIHALPFKGPVLAASAYGNLALRPFGDLDILIVKRDFQRTRDLLVGHGYRSSFAPASTQEAVHLRKHHDCLFASGNGQILVDLQWGLIQEPFAFPLNVEQLWRRHEPLLVANRRVASLSPEDLMLILCVHGAKHLWERLIWICDIAELVRTYPTLGWDQVVHQARTSGAERMLMLGVLLANGLLGAPVPRTIVRSAKAEPAVCSLALQTCEALFRGPNVSSTTIEDAPLFYLRMMERWQDRVRLCLRFYPSLLHPLPLVKRYGLSPLRHLIGR